ncbi:MAG TPA: Txe/YoeB family addiction module toxin [Saprospiraceae bacterium]|nr:Txe/YoeB family addiction module toxin [Saprospiraceae bacterium]
MEVIFLPDAEDDLQYWVSTLNKAIIKKIAQLIDDIQIHPYSGLGKPEPLKHNLSGAWSRRITKEHRLVYELDNDNILILSAKGHYL